MLCVSALLVTFLFVTFVHGRTETDVDINDNYELEHIHDLEIIDPNPEDLYLDINKLKSLGELLNESGIEVESETSTRPIFDKKLCNLPDSVLDHMYTVGEVQNDIAYTLLVGMAIVESTCTVDAESRTQDAGLLQINAKNIKWLGELAGIENVDEFNPYHNIEMAVAYLNHSREYFDQFDMSEEQKFYYIVGSYNQGVTGIRRYAKYNNIYNHPYVNKVLEAKSMIEQDIAERNEI